MPEHLLERDEMPSRITDLEIAMRNDLHEYARRAMRRSPSVVTSVLAYLVLRHGEIQDTYAIVHARVNGLSDALLLDALDSLREEAA